MNTERRVTSAEALPQLKPLTGIDLLGALIHEMSQPLTVLMGEFELAAACPPEAGGYQELVGRSLAEMNRLSACMVMFRDLAPIPDLKESSPVSLSAMLQRLCDVLIPAANAGGRRIELSCSADVWVRAPGHRLQLILARLMQKLLDMNGPGSVLEIGLAAHRASVSVGFSISRESRQCVETAVAKNGDASVEKPALNPKDPDWILARWVAESSGGSFEVASAESATWRLTMTFPRALHHDDAQRHGL